MTGSVRVACETGCVSGMHHCGSEWHEWLAVYDWHE